MEIPTWWLVITAIFALVGIAAFAALAYAMLTLTRKMNELQPKINAMNDKIERITERVENISRTIEDLAGTAKGTVDTVAGGANALISSLTKIGSKVEAGLAKFAPLLVGIKVAQNVFQAFSDAKKKKAQEKPQLPAKIVGE